MERDWERMVKFCDFRTEHWRRPRTTNVLESPFVALRLRTDPAKGFKRADGAIDMIGKMLMVVEGRFRRLKVPELMKEVHMRTVYKDGIVMESTQETTAA